MLQAIKSLFSFKDGTKVNRKHERDELQLAQDRALVSLSKLLHQCQLSRQSMEEKLSSIWGPTDDYFANSNYDPDAEVIDTELACACETLNSLTEKEHALQSEIYFTVRCHRPVPAEISLDLRIPESSFDQFKTNLTYAYRWTAQLVRGLAVKGVCLCLVKK